MIQRFIQRVGESTDMEAAPHITVDDLVSTPRSGLLVAEGGMGKSHFLEELKRRLTGKATFVRLAYFSGNQQGLANKIEGASKADTGHTLILDGLDEALDLAGTLCQCVTELPDDIHVWVASRECRQLAAVSDALKKLLRYRLLPFSEDDIKTRVKEEGLDVSKVESLLREHDLWNLCGNPLGCDFVLKAFAQNRDRGTWTSQEIWWQGIQSLCDENPSPTKALDPSACRFSREQVFDCTAWIALNLSLSGKNAVFMGVREADCPPSALPVSALEDGKNVSRDLIEISLQRGVFASWGGECAGFAHATYGDYLAAAGFQKHVPRGQWECLLLDRENRCLFAQRMGVAQWLMTDDSTLADQVFELSPESFLTRDLARLKMNGLCQALLNRADSVVGQLWRDSGFSLGSLKSPETLKVLRDFLFTSGSPANNWAIELAVDIARACEYWELLADFAVDETRDETRRQDAVFALSRCSDVEIKRRLRPMLDRLADKSDRWRGALLFVCWPDMLSVDEVLPFVVRPRNALLVETSGYRSFLGRRYFGPLLARLDPATSSKPLAWANEWLGETSGIYEVDVAKDWVCAVYTRYWNYAASTRSDELISLLADGYLAAGRQFKSPFLLPSVNQSMVASLGKESIPGECMWSQEAFVSHQSLRLAVLREVIRRDELKTGFVLRFAFDGSLLQNDDDLVRVAEFILASPFSEDAERWGRLLRYTWGQPFLETQSELVDRMHVARPDLFPLTCWEILAEAEHSRKEREETERTHKDAMEKDAAKWVNWQQQLDRKIKDDLATDNIPLELFTEICTYLYAEKGNFGDWDKLDFRQAGGWKKLSDIERERLIRLAERFLREAPPPPEGAEARGSDLVWHRALLTLKRAHPDVYEKLPEVIWQKCAVELLRFHVNDACQELYDDLARKFPAVASDALIRCLPHEYGWGVLNAWGDRLAEAQAEAVFDALFGSDSCGVDDALPVRCFNEFPSDRCTSVKNPVCDQVLSCLAQHQPNVVRRRVGERLKDGFAFQLGHPFYDVLRRYALQLDSDKYFPSFLRTLEAQSDWGRRWLETPAIASEWNELGGFRNAFFSRSAEEIGVVYEWLDNQYPPEKCPRHESGTSYVPSMLDRIYGFKGRLFTVLVESGKKGSAQVIEKVLAKNPEGFMGHVATARRNEAAARLPTLSAQRIHELTDEKKTVIASVHDLQRYVLTLLKNYQVLLQGTPPAVGHLWNTNKPASPKKEEDVSDHLVRYLKDKRAGAIFANREVQISRKLADGGETGARTDIWIDCATVCQETVSLCIEVKCSWNQSAKTAIADQLVSRYMSAGRADAGILLLAWFHGDAWKTGGAGVWPSPADAKTDLEQQVQARKAEIKKPLDVFVLDCTL